MAKLLLVTIFAVILVSLANACPTIVSRAAWGARPANTAALSTFPPTHVVVHHTVTGACTTQAACSAQMRAMQNHHMDGNGWADIGYNFLIGGDGLVYEGRGWGRTGAHTVSFNARSIGLAFIGTFTSVTPNAAAVNAYHSLISCGLGQGQISQNYWLMGHRQGANTACPGNALFAQIQGWPRWTANP